MPSVPARRRPAPPDPPAFADRAEAGERLCAALRQAIEKFKVHPVERPVVFAVPRGGVAVAAGVARCLAAPLELIVVRKIGHPGAPEFGLGAIAEGGEPVYDQAVLAEAGLSVADLTAVVERERAELARRVGVYRGARDGAAHLDRPADGGPAGGALVGDAADGGLVGEGPPGGLAIVVDDGLATGVTARAALRAVARRFGAGPVRTVLAVPVASTGSLEAINAEADEVVTVVTARRLRSVGEWYADFGQLTDADVLTLLAEGQPREEGEP
jgi:putative phosphoribosyl transferase